MPGAEAEETGAPRLRRATRADIPALLDDVGGPPAGRLRCLRRLLKTLVADVYVLERSAGIAGLISVTYRRSLAHGGLVGTIDLLRLHPVADPGAADETASLLAACAIDRARRRGCVALESPPVDPATARALERAGLLEVAALRVLSLRSSSPAPDEVGEGPSRGEA